MIRELHVTCLASEAVAPDVGLRLRRGESAWLPADALQQSVVLRGLVAVKAVIVNLERRYASLRVPPVAKAPRVRPSTPAATATVYVAPPRPTASVVSPKPPPPAGFQPLPQAEGAPAPKRRGRPPKSKPEPDDQE